jgi:hypothetical protein
MSAPTFLDVKTNAHVETAHDMIDLDESNLGGCQGQYWLTEAAGRTVVLQKESRILPVDHMLIHTPRAGGGTNSLRDMYIYEDRTRSWNGRSDLVRGPRVCGGGITDSARPNRCDGANSMIDRL